VRGEQAAAQVIEARHGGKLSGVGCEAARRHLLLVQLL
jgi:hypothetical protein